MKLDKMEGVWMFVYPGKKLGNLRSCWGSIVRIGRNFCKKKVFQRMLTNGDKL